MRSQSPARKVDVIVLGGGPAGTATALALACQGVCVLVVERSLYKDARIGETFPPAIQWVLTQLGLWESFVAAHHVTSAGIRGIWGSAEPYERSFIFDPYGNGWHVDRRAFDCSLARAAERRGVWFALGSRLLAYERDISDGWKLLVASHGHTFHVCARFVVDATGRASTFTRRVGGRRIALDQLVCIFGFFKGVADNPSGNGLTLIEAVEDGWWYSATLPRARLVVAYMTDTDLCAGALTRKVFHWESKLRFALETRARAAPYLLDGALRVLSANSSRVDRAWGPGWLTVGDAAAAYDPLSGDGVHRALQAGIRAAQAILSAWSGDKSAFQRYSQELEEGFSIYLQQRNAYYGREKRWINSPFWLRRRGLPRDA